MKFSHLHVHSHYSLLDGLPKIDELLDYAKELGMDSIALTDHGVLYGAIEFYKKAKAKGIKPIIGCEVYTAFEKMTDKRPNIDDKRYHLVLLAKNETGYKNLVKLVTKAHLEGFYYKPRIDDHLLAKHSQGLIAMTACIAGRIPRLIIAKKHKEAEELALKYQKMFGKDNFYLEIQDHSNIPEQKIVNQALISMSKKYGIPLVATNDSHYAKKEDAEAQDILMMINTGTDRSDPERKTIESDDFSIRNPEEMIQAFKDVPQAIENTQKIAEMCNIEFELGKTKLPKYEVPNGKTTNQYIEELCEQGLKKRYINPSKEIKQRLKYELSVIEKTGFASYFLIVQDFVNWAKEQRIVVGPGRGSAAGSIVAYLLNITDVDPLKNDLLFERFLNPERISMPDIDLDFTDRRRDEVIEYVAQKYGRDKVAQIITFGTMAAKAAIRDVGRALGYQYGYCDQIAKMIPFGFKLKDTFKIKEFKELYESDEQAKRLIDLAQKLEGVARHASTHACGVVVSDQPLSNIIPLQFPTQNDKSIVTQYEMHSVEDLGLLKMDFLGLKNLTIIEDTLSRIYVLRDKLKIDFQNVPLDDKKTYELLQKGITKAVFQLEGDGMTNYLKQLKPTEFEDIVAMIALYRPGPMQFIPEYIARKHKKKNIEYLHPKLEPILKKTQGICIYQEELMQIAQHLAGFSLAEADILRKAVGKKIKHLLDAQEEKFIKGVIENKIDKKIAIKLWQWILPFAQYGFNKCLSQDSEIFLYNGSVKTIEELYKENNLENIISLNENLKLKKGKISKIIKNGLKPVYEIQTGSGRKIQATENHRFLTENGWKKLKNIKSQERLALARNWPTNTNEKWPYHKLALLGQVISEGNTCHPTSFYLYTNSKEELDDYIKNLEKFENTEATVSIRKGERGKYSVYAKRTNPKKKSEAVEWIMNELDLKYKKATEKKLPLSVFNLKNKYLSIILGKMWNGDGCIDAKRGIIYYATSSEKLAEQIQNLLLRMGVIAKIHKKNFHYRNTIKIGWTISTTRYDNIMKFHENIYSHLVGKRKKDLEKLIKKHNILKNSNYEKQLFARGTFDTVPITIRGVLKQECQDLNMSLKTTAKLADVSERLFYLDPRKKGYQRETLSKINKILNSSIIKAWAESDIFWDKIKSIKYAGKKETYDLTINENHNFLTNGIITHNSHSAAYATIAYQTAYLKAHYPVEFMAAALTSEKNDVDRIASLINECKNLKIGVLPPNINESLKNFTVVPKKNEIRFGLLAIKNVGEGVIDAITEERKNGQFESIGNFLTRVNSKDLNKKSLESLIKAGAFDEFKERNQLLQNLEKLLEWSKETQKNKSNGQKGLFESFSLNNNMVLEPATQASNFEKLSWEKELLGLYVSSHPLEDYKEVLKKKALPIRELKQSFMGQRVRIGGIISNIKKIITKMGRPMLFVKLEDLTDKTEVVVFPGVIERNPTAFQENKIVFILGKVDHKDTSPKVIADQIEEIVTS